MVFGHVEHQRDVFKLAEFLELVKGRHTLGKSIADHVDQVGDAPFQALRGTSFKSKAAESIRHDLSAVRVTNRHDSASSPNKTFDIAADQVGIIRQVGVRWASFVALEKTWDVNLEAGLFKSRGEFAVACRSVKRAADDDKCGLNISSHCGFLKMSKMMRIGEC